MCVCVWVGVCVCVCVCVLQRLSTITPKLRPESVLRTVILVDVMVPCLLQKRTRAKNSSCRGSCGSYSFPYLKFDTSERSQTVALNTNFSIISALYLSEFVENDVVMHEISYTNRMCFPIRTNVFHPYKLMSCVSRMSNSRFARHFSRVFSSSCKTAHNWAVER